MLNVVSLAGLFEPVCALTACCDYYLVAVYGFLFAAVTGIRNDNTLTYAVFYYNILAVLPERRFR